MFKEHLIVWFSKLLNDKTNELWMLGIIVRFSRGSHGALLKDVEQVLRDATKQLYAAIDMIKDKTWQEIKSALDEVNKLTENREVKKVPKPGSGSSDEGF